MIKKISGLVLLCLFIGCKKTTIRTHDKTTENKKEVVKQEKKYAFDLQGHRGARGLFPENTLVAFKKALELGVNTVELDVVITKDKKVLVSHEPWLNADICLDISGNKIEKSEEMKYNIYGLTYDEIKKVDCGSLGNPRFSKQQKVKATKPLLTEVIDLVENYSTKNNVSVAYNIEIKSDPRGDNVFHPVPSEFSDLLISVLKSKKIENKVTVQSFDTRTLEYVHKKYPELTLAYLVYNQDVAESLTKMSFIPPIYSPDYKMLSKENITSLHKKGMKVIPWTINDKQEMVKLLDWGVDGIITDYPDIAKQIHQ